MTNEELAVLAQSGDQTALAELWERNRPLCIKHSRKYMGLCVQAGIDVEDLMQELYFGFHAAVEAFEPNKGFAFTTYLTRHCWRVCADALHVRNGRKLPPRPVSLQAPVGEEDSDAEIQDLIADEAGEQPHEDVENRLYIEQFRTALNRSFGTLSETDARIIRAIYFQNKTLSALASELGCSHQRVHQLKQKAIAALRKSPYIQGFNAV